MVFFSYSSFAASATTGGTMKVYINLWVFQKQSILFPAQYSGPLAADVINIDGGNPATGIPQVTGNIGQAGVFVVNGTLGNTFIATSDSQINLTGPSNISAALSLWGDAGYTTSAPTVISSGSAVNVYVKASIHSGTQLSPGTYTGTATVAANPN